MEVFDIIDSTVVIAIVIVIVIVQFGVEGKFVVACCLRTYSQREYIQE